MVNKVTFAVFRGVLAPWICPVSYQRSTRTANKNSAPRAQVRLLLSSQKKIKFFQWHVLSKAFCHFPDVRMRMNAFREEAFAGPQRGRIQI